VGGDEALEGIEMTNPTPAALLRAREILERHSQINGDLIIAIACALTDARADGVRAGIEGRIKITSVEMTQDDKPISATIKFMELP
jgi:hypothetical protein